MNTIKNMVGIRSNAQQRQAELADAAARAQKRASNAAIEDAAVIRAETAASGRRLRGAGKRTLAFMGNEMGVSDQLAGGTA